MGHPPTSPAMHRPRFAAEVSSRKRSRFPPFENRKGWGNLSSTDLGTEVGYPSWSNYELMNWNTPPKRSLNGAPSLVIVSFAKTHETLNVKNNNGLDDVLLRPALDVATCSCTDSHLVWTFMESDEWAHGWCRAGKSC